MRGNLRASAKKLDRSNESCGAFFDQVWVRRAHTERKRWTIRFHPRGGLCSRRAPPPSRPRSPPRSRNRLGIRRRRVSICGSSAISMSEPTRPRAKAFSTAWSDSGHRRCAPSRWRRRFASLRRAAPSAGPPSTRPYPIDGTWERYTFKVGNIRFLMMGDRNDLPYPVGRRASGGASPAGAVTPETFAWWTSHVESAGKDEIIVTGAHHMLRETTVGSGDYEGVSRNPDGTFRSGRYHGPDGAPEGASYLYFLGEKPKAQAFENYLVAHPGAIDLWVGGHTHTHPDDVRNGRSHVERKWGVNFVNCAQLSKFHSYVTCPPMSRHFTFTEGSRLVRVRCYLHDDTHAAEGWYPPAERVLEFSKPFYWD